MLTNVLLIILLVVVLGILAFLFRNRKKDDTGRSALIIEEVAQLRAELSQRDKIIGRLTAEVKEEKSLKDELVGKNKQLFEQITNTKAENDNLQKENKVFVKQLSDYEAQEEENERKINDRIKSLETSTTKFEEEKLRVRKEDEEKQQKEKEERNRMWAEHEIAVRQRIIDLCKASQYNFSYYDNKNLPADFGGKFKPDILIEFLGQYVIFDAKKSESDLQNYINTNVKSTVEKINGNQKIYPTVFFVVPTEAIKQLKTTRFYEQGFDFFVISPEAVESILASLKKISSYELAQQLDPQDRENIVNLIAEFDHHINMRNAVDILVAESGVSILKKANTLRPDIKEEIGVKKDKIRLQQFAPTDIKTLMLNVETQEEKIEEIISPKASISEENLKKVKPVLKDPK
jgi:hypothetical protein